MIKRCGVPALLWLAGLSLSAHTGGVFAPVYGGWEECMRPVKPWKVVATLNCGDCIAFSHVHHILAEYKIAFWSRWVLWEQLGFSRSSSTELDSRRWKEKAGKASRTDNILKFMKLLSWISGTYIHSLVMISILFIRMLFKLTGMTALLCGESRDHGWFLEHPWTGLFPCLIFPMMGTNVDSAFMMFFGIIYHKYTRTSENNNNSPVSMGLWRKESIWGRRCQCRSIFGQRLKYKE